MLLSDFPLFAIICNLVTLQFRNFIFRAINHLSVSLSAQHLQNLFCILPMQISNLSLAYMHHQQHGQCDISFLTRSRHFGDVVDFACILYICKRIYQLPMQILAPLTPNLTCAYMWLQHRQFIILTRSRFFTLIGSRSR